MKRLLCIVLVLVWLTSGITAVPTAQSVVALGDPDASGRTDAADALMALQYSVDKLQPEPLQVSACDVDCSSVVDALDALQMLQLSVGKLSAFAPTGLSGMEITLGSVYASKYTDSSAYGQAWQQAIKAVEESLGVKVLVKQLDLNTDANSLWLYDLVELPVVTARSYAKQGLLKNLNDNIMPDWQVLCGGSTGSCTMGDMICGAASPVMSACPMGLAINAPLLQRYAPQAYSKMEQQFADGTWTFAALSALVAEYRSNRANSPVMLSNTNIIGQAIVANAGYEVKFLEDGSGAVCSIASEEGIEALTYIKDLLDQGAWRYMADIGAMYQAFQAGEAPILVYYLGDAASAAAGKLTLTAMPFPKGPQQQDYVMCTFNSSTFAVPQLADHYGNAAVVVLNELAKRDQILADGLVAGAAQGGYDALGQSVYAWSAKHTSLDFSGGPFTAAVGGPVDGSVLDSAQHPANLTKISDLIQREVDSFYGQFYR